MAVVSDSNDREVSIWIGDKPDPDLSIVPEGTVRLYVQVPRDTVFWISWSNDLLLGQVATAMGVTRAKGKEKHDTLWVDVPRPA